MGNFKEDQKRRDLLIYAFYERKQNRDDWIGRIGVELAEQRQSPDPEKSIEKMEIALEAWRSLHPVIERYPDAASEWDKLHFPELWEIVTKDRDLSNVIYNGILLLKSKIIERRDSAGLPALHKDMKNLAYGKDSKDYQKWELLNELEDGLHDAFRQDQPQQTAPPAGDQEECDKLAFEILQKQYDSASEQDQKQYFFSNKGRHKKGVHNQDVYFEPALKQFNKANNGGLEMSTFIKIVCRFKKALKDGNQIKKTDNG